MNNPIREEDLLVEMDEIISFAECIVKAVDNKTHSTLIITPAVYAKHIAVLYFVIEAMRQVVKKEAAASKEFKCLIKLEEWMSQKGVW